MLSDNLALSCFFMRGRYGLKPSDPYGDSAGAQGAGLDSCPAPCNPRLHGLVLVLMIGFGRCLAARCGTIIAAHHSPAESLMLDVRLVERESVASIGP